MIIKYNDYICFGREHIGGIQSTIILRNGTECLVVWWLSIFHIGPIEIPSVKRFGAKYHSSHETQQIDAECRIWQLGGSLPSSIRL